MQVRFGNSHPVAYLDNPTPGDSRPVAIHHDHIRATYSYLDLPEHWKPETNPANLAEWQVDESFRSITYPGGWWSQHSTETPTWIEVDGWPELEAILRVWYGVTERPEGWDFDIDPIPTLRVEYPNIPTPVSESTEVAPEGEVTGE